MNNNIYTVSGYIPSIIFDIFILLLIIIFLFTSNDNSPLILPPSNIFLFTFPPSPVFEYINISFVLIDKSNKVFLLSILVNIIEGVSTNKCGLN